MSTKAVVLFSGGMDSTYALYDARQFHDQVEALAVDYGQRHAEPELLAARQIAAKLQVPLTLMRMRIDWQVTLCATTRALRNGIDEDGVSHAFVPGRNLHFLTLAAAHARKVGADRVVIGCCADDAHAFPDCRPGFLQAAATALSLALDRTIAVHAPLVRHTKAAILRMATPEVRALMDQSWSCYTPTRAGEPCAECDACKVRAAAYAEAAL